MSKFKETMQRRIEHNAIKVNVNGEDILLKKSGLFVKEWHRFHPPINEDGSWNWMNFIFGGKSNLVNLIAILVIIALLFIGIGEIFGGLQKIIDTPCVQSCINAVKIT
jgi:hypothetical protein